MVNSRHGAGTGLHRQGAIRRLESQSDVIERLVIDNVLNNVLNQHVFSQRVCFVYFAKNVLKIYSILIFFLHILYIFHSFFIYFFIYKYVTYGL